MRVYEALKEPIRENPDTVDPALDALTVARHLERIADLATNIAEDVIFIVDVVRHVGALERGWVRCRRQFRFRHL